MTLQQWAYVGEIVASAAVVASLIYLAIQVRQSNKLVRAQTRQVMMQMGKQDLHKFVDDPAMMTLWVKEPISAEERLKLYAWLMASMRQREYEWLEHKHGTMDPDTVKAYAGVTALVLGTERTRQWWAVQGHRHPFHPGFVEYVDRMLEQTPLTDYFDAFEFDSSSASEHAK